MHNELDPLLYVNNQKLDLKAFFDPSTKILKEKIHLKSHTHQ